jgi:hypothetical protein
MNELPVEPTSTPRSASVALAVIRHLPIDELILLVVAYEDVWIPPILKSVEGWFRSLTDRLARRIYDEVIIAKYYDGGWNRSTTANIVDYRYGTEIKNEIHLIAISKDFSRYEFVSERSISGRLWLQTSSDPELWLIFQFKEYYLPSMIS